MENLTIIIAGVPGLALQKSQELKQCGFLVHEVSSAADLLPAIQEAVPDCVLLDLALLDSYPHEAIAQLRALDAMQRSALVLMSSAASCVSSLDPFSLPVDDYLPSSFLSQDPAIRLRAAVVRRRFICREESGDSDCEQQSMNLYPALQEILCELSHFKNLGRCSVALLEHEQRQAHVVASSDAPPSAKWCLDLADYPELCEVSRTGTLLVVPDVRTSPLMAPVLERLDPQGFRSLLVVPVMTGGRVAGALVLRFHEQEPELSREDFFFCRLMAIMFARLLGSAVQENAPSFGGINDGQAMERFLRKRDEFAANAFHALRTPVAAIHGFGSLLRESGYGQLGADQRDYLDKVMTHCEELSGLLENIFDLSRLISGQSCLDVAPRDLTVVLRSVYEKTWPQALSRGLLFQWDLPAGPCPAFFENEGIQQVVCGQVENAIHHAPMGSTVYVRVKESREYLCVIIEDASLMHDSEDEGCDLRGALYRAIMEGHRGRLEVAPSEKGGRCTKIFLRQARDQ